DRRAVPGRNGEAARPPARHEERQRHRLPAVQHHPDQPAAQSVDRKAGVKKPIAMVLLAFAANAGAQSLSYTKGQNVAPAYEGWEQDANGTKYFLFGYMNRNWEEEIDVPVGPDNGFNVGGADQGQPTHFLPRRNRFIFRVKVPANFGEKDE